MSADDSGDSVFLRETSGVIRNVGASDTFLYDVALINIGIGIAFIMLLFPFYPNASVPLAIIIATAGAMFIGITYYLFSSAMPRNGAVYTYLSRSIHPAVGFTMSFNMVIWLLFFSAISATYLANMGLGPLFLVLGTEMGINTLVSWGQTLSPPAGTFVSSNLATFVIGTISVIISTVLLISGNRQYFRSQWITVGLGWIGILVLLGFLLVTSQEAFIANFNDFTGGSPTYQEVIDIAQENGYGQAETTLWGTLEFMVWPFYTLPFAIMSAVFAGEIKKVSSSQLMIPASQVIVGITFVLLAIAAVQTMGAEFLGSIAWNFFVAPEGSTEVIPWIGMLASLNAPLIITLLIGLGFVGWAWVWIPGCQIYGTRAMLAWSIDRVAPDQLGQVSSKYHTPVVATILCGIIAEIWLVIYLFIPLTQAIIAIGAMTITFAFVGIGAIVFPYTQTEMFENSSADYRIAGIPMMSVVGLVAAMFSSLMIYFFYTDPLIGAGSPIAVAASVAVFAIGLLIFYGMKYYRKQQGIDIERAYEEVPVE